MLDQLGRVRFAIDEQGDGLVQKRLRKGRIVLHARGDGFFEITDSAVFPHKLNDPCSETRDRPGSVPGF